jgi:hypothetical protein
MPFTKSQIEVLTSVAFGTEACAEIDEFDDRSIASFRLKYGREVHIEALADGYEIRVGKTLEYPNGDEGFEFERAFHETEFANAAMLARDILSGAF